MSSQPELHDLASQFGLARSRPVLALVGGASRMEPAALARLKTVFDEVLAPLIDALGGIVIDGGTDCGVMQLMGQARSRCGGQFPLIGVCAIGTVALPDGTPPQSDDAAPLEPNHSHFVFVPGCDWGAESPWLARLATILADGAPACTLVSNGGSITWQDVECSVAEGRTTLVLEGSGRTADELAAALHGTPNDRAEPLIASGCLALLSLNGDLGQLGEAVRARLAPQLAPTQG